MSNDLELKKIDLSTWTCFSDRVNSKSYVSADKKWMVKFSSDTYLIDEMSMYREQEMARKALRIGVKTPIVGDVVIDDEGRKGLIFEYIEDKKSISRLFSEDLDNIDKYMKRFAEAAKEFHSTVCDTKDFDSMHERVVTQVTMRNILFESQKTKALKFLETIEQQKFCVHGDFQTGNVIVSGDKSYWIDLNFMGYGNPEFDIGVFYTFCHIFPKQYTDTVFHCDRKYLPIIWNSFVRYYYETENEKVIAEKTERARKLSSICLYTNLQFVKFDESKAPVMRQLIDDAL